MTRCEICGKEYKNLFGLSKHISKIHNVSSEEYYLKYLGEKRKCEFCGKETKFKNLVIGYQKYCNLKCSNNDPNRKKMFHDSYLLNNMEEIKEKRANTNLIRHGNRNANLNEEIKKRNRDSFLFGQIEKKINYLKKFDIKILSDFKYNNYNTLETFKCNKCGKVFNQTLANISQRIYKCSCLKPASTSIGENEVKDFIKSILPTEVIIFNEKIENKEIDILIHSKKIAIEYNGLYWHSEQILKDPINYHLDKLLLCQKYGYKLIQIFEDEWFSNREIVKKRICHILNKDINNIIYARKCTIKEIDSRIKNEFLEKFHIQGADKSIIKIGAFYNDELVSVMTFGHGNISKGSVSIEGIWELNRFCSNYNYHIPGIASKLLTHFKRNYEWKEIFSYADRRWSDGNLYEKIGFKLDHITKPNYWYVKNINRLHRFGLRKRSDEPKDIPEWVLRQVEGYYRIWDCGNLKFSMINKMEV